MCKGRKHMGIGRILRSPTGGGIHSTRRWLSSMCPPWSEMVGAVRGIDPETNHHYDDTRRYVDQVAALSAENRAKIFEGNARTVASTPILIAEVQPPGPFH